MLSIPDAFTRVRKTIFRIPTEPASWCDWWWGTGFFISPDGYALTAFHNLPADVAAQREGVVKGILLDQTEIHLRYVYSKGDEQRDIAVLKACVQRDEEYPHAHLAALDANLNERERSIFWAVRPVVVVGFPLYEKGSEEDVISGHLRLEIPFGIEGETRADGISCQIERLRIVPDRHRRLFGISGGPILDLESGCVVGVEGSYDKKRGLILASELRFNEPEWPSSVHRLIRTLSANSKVWTVPYDQNLFFTGRNEVLDNLRMTLVARRRVALSGLGGIGKTQTAIEYAYRYRDEYEAILWMNADSREALISDLIAMAGRLKLPVKDEEDQTAIVAAVRDWFISHNDWLLVLDNADDLNLAREYIPSGVIGHVLLTTRAQSTDPIAQRLEIKKMKPEEGTVFLLRRANVIEKDEQLDAASNEDKTLAKEISEKMGYLPLALDQAGAFIEETPSSLAEYLDLYNSEGVKLRAKRGELTEGHAPVAITFSLAFDQLAESNLAATDLVRVCAFLAPEAIPEKIFSEGAAELGEHLSVAATNKLEFLKAINDAGRFSLIQRNATSESLDIHPLVQDVLKDGMDEAARRLWAKRTVLALYQAFPSTEYTNWSLCNRLLPHVEVAKRLIERWDFEFEEAIFLLNQVGVYLKEHARYDEAELFFKQALYMNPGRLTRARIMNNRADNFDRLRQHVEAESHYQQALDIEESEKEPDHLSVAKILNHFAGHYYNQGRYTEAEPLYLRALAIREKERGPDHPDVAEILSNLALLYNSQGRYIEAEPHCLQALTIQRRKLGEDDPDVAATLNILGVIYHNQSQFDKAEHFYQQALIIREKDLGPDHLAIAESLSNLALLYRDQGRYAEAKEFCQRALAIMKGKLEPDHPDVAKLYRVQSQIELLAMKGEREYVTNGNNGTDGKFERLALFRLFRTLRILFSAWLAKLKL